MIKNGRSNEPLINEIYETSDCVCYVEQLFAILSDEICYEWTNFIKWIPEKKKISLPELYTIAKSDSMSSTDNPESPWYVYFVFPTSRLPQALVARNFHPIFLN
jgi:hypothetical protein